MKKYQMTCTCGTVMSVEANSLDEGKAKMKQMMDQAALDAHWAEKHASDTNPKPTLEQSHAMIDQMLQELMVAPM